jgi:hypothetical protein
MILKLPEHFDQNEWFIIIVILLSLIMFKRLPKRFPKAITTIIVLYSIAMPKIFDHTIAVKPYNLYDLTDSGKYELFDVIMYAIYPPFGYLFIYLYDYFKIKGIRFVLYIFIWALAALGMEFITNKLHVYNYHGWKLIYSLPTYTGVMIIHILLFNFSMRYFRANIQTQSTEK